MVVTMRRYQLEKSAVEPQMKKCQSITRRVSRPDFSENSLWGANWFELRDEWGLDYSVYHFNHGAYGAVPKRVRAEQRALIHRIDRNPTGFFRRQLLSLLEDARLQAAEFCGAEPTNFAWVRNATEGVNVALNAVPLKHGDEVLITDHIYSAVRLVVEKKCAESGAIAIEAIVPLTADDTEIVSSIGRRITQRTRLLIVDEIASPTARLFPVEELARLCRQNDIVLLVDGAHAPGMYPLALETLGADLWVGNFHKWICAPHGAAALWAAPRWHEHLKPTSVSFRDRLPFPQNFGRLGTDDLTPVLCVPPAINFLNSIGAESIQNYNRDLARLGAEVIRQHLGTSRVAGRFAARHPVELPHGIVTDETSARELQTTVGVELKAEVSVSEPLAEGQEGALVISAFAYNHPLEYEDFAHALKQCLLC